MRISDWSSDVCSSDLRALFGDEHPDVARTLTALADLMSITGEYTKGEPLIQEALRIRRALYGTVHADIAESIGDLGVNYGERGEFAKAEVYLRSEENTSELQSLMRNSYAVFCLKKKRNR